MCMLMACVLACLFMSSTHSQGFCIAFVMLVPIIHTLTMLVPNHSHTHNACSKSLTHSQCLFQITHTLTMLVPSTHNACSKSLTHSQCLFQSMLVKDLHSTHERVKLHITVLCASMEFLCVWWILRNMALCPHENFQSWAYIFLCSPSATWPPNAQALEMFPLVTWALCLVQTGRKTAWERSDCWYDVNRESACVTFIMHCKYSNIIPGDIWIHKCAHRVLL